jgi:hypothetical protein
MTNRLNALQRRSAFGPRAPSNSLFLLRLAEFVQNDEIGRANSDAPFGHFSRFGERAGVRATWMGELLPSSNRQQGVSGARRLRSGAVAPVVALQAQGQAK